MNLEEMKKLYESGEYLLVTKCIAGQLPHTWYLKNEKNAKKFFGLKGWKQSDYDANYQFKLIHKKHKHILDAYLKDSSVEIEYNDIGGGWTDSWDDEPYELIEE